MIVIDLKVKCNTGEQENLVIMPASEDKTKKNTALTITQSTKYKLNVIEDSQEISGWPSMKKYLTL